MRSGPEIAFILDGGHVLCASLVARMEPRRRARRLSFRIVPAVTGTGGVISLLWQPVDLDSLLARTKAAKILFFYTAALSNDSDADPAGRRQIRRYVSPCEDCFSSFPL